MRRIALLLIVSSLVILAGCNRQADDQPLQAALQEIQALETRLDQANQRVAGLAASVRRLDTGAKETEASLILLPELRKDVTGLTARIEQLQDHAKASDEILALVSVRDNQLVVRGLIVGERDAQSRCVLSPRGLVISDEQGRDVCDVSYRAGQGATAQLQSPSGNRVLIHADDQQAAIAAHSPKAGGLKIRHKSSGVGPTTSLELLKSSGAVGWSARIEAGDKVVASE